MRTLLFCKAIVVWTSISSAQQLAFLTPNGGDPVQYSEGEDVRIRWSTPFPLTNVEVWQGPRQDGSYGMHTLQANTTPEKTAISWRATALDGIDFQHGFQFRLQKGDQPNFCAGCIATSQQFWVKPAPRLLANPVPVKAQTALPVKAQTNATASEATTSGVSVKAELGAALGISLGGAAIILAFCVLWGLKKYRHKKGLRKAQKHPLGEVKQLPFEPEQKLQYNLYQSSVRGSYTTTGTSASKAPSYFEPFEFEDDDGQIREGWYSLWGDGRPSRMSATPFRKSILKQPRQAVYR